MTIDILIVLIGLVFGSFLNVCVYRLPRGKSIIKGRSHCPHCANKIAFYDNLPIISYLLLGGRCRHCQKRIALQYPLVELIAALLTWGLYRKFGLSYPFIFYTIFVYFMIIIAVIDLQTRLILNKVLLWLFILALPFLLISPELDLKDAFLGGLLGGCVMYLVALFGNRIFRKEAMGMGDVKFAMVAGLFIGWKMILWALYLGFVIALLVVGLLALLRKGKLPAQVPMGPFFAAGMILQLFYGVQLWQLYMHLFR